jgi:hypothetical protein
MEALAQCSFDPMCLGFKQSQVVVLKDSCEVWICDDGKD